MKKLSDSLRAHIASGVTTLCWCWRLTRHDGLVLGFTDHDRDLAFDGTVFEAAAGFTAGEMKDAIGLSVDNLEVSSALSSARLEEADLAAGRYDDAQVEIFRVNWQETSQRILMRTGSLGEVRRADASFVAEVRGLAHYLQQPSGRLFQYTCDANLGDGRCGIDISSPSYRATATVTNAFSSREFEVTGLAAFANDWFTRGLANFTSGAASGQAIEIKRHSAVGGTVAIELWQPARAPIVAGQSLTLTAGCDKHLATCRDKFANAINYRGFPHMPGNDLVTSYFRPGAQ